MGINASLIKSRRNTIESSINKKILDYHTGFKVQSNGKNATYRCALRVDGYLTEFNSGTSYEEISKYDIPTEQKKILQLLKQYHYKTILGYEPQILFIMNSDDYKKSSENLKKYFECMPNGWIEYYNSYIPEYKFITY